MYYSLTFGDEKNTWDDWKLIPDSPPSIPYPEAAENMVDIPGRARGPLDLSRIPFGRLTYQRVTGSWSFLREIDGKDERIAAGEELRNWLHYRETTVKLEEDPNHYYKGKFTVSNPRCTNGPMMLSIGYSLEPVRYNLDGTIDETYVPARQA